MRVVHLITDLDVGGAEMMLARLVTNGTGERIESTVICLSQAGPVADTIRAAGVPVHVLGARQGRLNLSAFPRLIGLLRQLRPDILQTWLYHADLSGLIAGRLARVGAVVWNLRCAELEPADHPASTARLLKLLAVLSRHPDAIVCNSAAGQREHQAVGYRPRRWRIIPNGFDVVQFAREPAAQARLKRQLGVGNDVQFVGLLARSHPMKDHATFVRAAAIVAGSHARVVFVAAGRNVPADPALRAQIETLALNGRIRLLDEQAEPATFLAGLDIAVSSSYSEGFPNVVGEAMACGVPCVVTDVGDSAALVGDTGLVVPPRNPEALAAAILRMLNMNPAARAKLGEAARSRIVARYSLAEAAAQYHSLYEELTSGPE